MQRHEMIDAMRGLGLKGMVGAYDEAVTTGVQRQRSVTEIYTPHRVRSNMERAVGVLRAIHACLRCRIASYRVTAALMETFRLSVSSRMGITMDLH